MVFRLFRRRTPFDRTRGVPPPGRCPPDRLDPDQAAEAIRRAPVEVGYGFAANGRQVFRQVGDAQRVMHFRSEDLVAIKNGIFMHNLPSDVEFPVGDPRRRAGSFSPTDLTFTVEHDMAAMTLVSHERTYFIARPPGGLSLDAGEVSGISTRLFDEHRRRPAVAAKAGIVASVIPEAHGALADEVMANLLRDFVDRREDV